MAALGFIPGYIVSFILKQMGLLRAPREAELMGLDKAKVPAIAYPELLGEVRAPTSPAE
jgi:ammonium transporter, Amt family